MKKYEDERINFLLEQLQEDIKLDNESSSIDVNSVLNQLYVNIDKVVDYTKNGCKGDLYLKSNIWENCYYTLSQILGLYNLKLIEKLEPIQKVFILDCLYDSSFFLYWLVL